MRKASLDLCRIVACLAVVMIHTVMLFWDFDPLVPTWALYNFLSLAVRFGVPLFFMLSGALLLGRETLDLKKHLGRTGRFVLLFYVWSLLCYGLDAAFFHVWTPGANFLSLVLSGYYHEWFLPALVLCYCALPLLHGLMYREEKNVRAGVWLLCGLAVLLTGLSSVPDKSPLFAALLGPWQLSDLRYQIESLQSTLNNWDRRVSYSSIYLELSEVKAYTPEPEQRLSYGQELLGALGDGLRAVGNFFKDLLVLLAAALPALLVLAVLLLLLVPLVRKLRNRRKAKKAAGKNPPEAGSDSAAK